MKRNLGLALMLGGVGYTVYRAYLAGKAGLNLATWLKTNYATSGAVPSAAAVGIGAYLYWR